MKNYKNHNEVAAAKTAERKERDLIIKEWLKRNPEIGMLNSGSFYKFQNGEMIAVNAPFPKEKNLFRIPFV